MENPNLAKTSEVLQAHIASQLAQTRESVMGSTPSIISKDELTAAESIEDVINTLLKKRGLNRQRRRSIIANRRKPRGASRK